MDFAIDAIISSDEPMLITVEGRNLARITELLLQGRTSENRIKTLKSAEEKSEILICALTSGQQENVDYVFKMCPLDEESEMQVVNFGSY